MIAERVRAKSLKRHGATGVTPDMYPIEACRHGICMKCGGMWGPLYLHIPSHYPNVPSKDAREKYRRDFRIPDDVSLTADWHRRRLADGRLKFMRGPAGENARLRIAESLSRPRPDLYGKTGRHPSGKAIPTWEIVKRLTKGDSLVQVAKNVGAGNHKLIQRRAAAVGLAFGTALMCDHGEPFRNRSLAYMRKVTGFEVTDFVKFVGLRSARSLARSGESILNPQEARMAIEWRDGILRALLGVRSLHVAGKDYRKDDLLRRMLPTLPEVNSFMGRTIGDLRKDCREHPEWTVNELCEAVCIEAQREQSISRVDNRWRNTLRYLWQIESFLNANLDRLRSSEADGVILREMIGARYRVKRVFTRKQRSVFAALQPSNVHIGSKLEWRLLFSMISPHRPRRTSGRFRALTGRTSRPRKKH